MVFRAAERSNLGLVKARLNRHYLGEHVPLSTSAALPSDEMEVRCSCLCYLYSYLRLQNRIIIAIFIIYIGIRVHYYLRKFQLTTLQY